FVNQRRKAVIENSVVVAHAYLNESAQQIAGDMIAVANDLARARPLLDQDRDSFRRYFQSGAQARNLPVAMLIDKDRNVLESVSIGINQAFATPESEILANITEDKPDVAVYENYAGGVIRLRAYDDTFLYVARLLDPRVVSRVQETQQGAAAFV